MDARTCGLHQEARKRVARSVPCPTRVRFEEEDTADVWASFVSETERGGGLLPLMHGTHRLGSSPTLLSSPIGTLPDPESASSPFGVSSTSSHLK